MDTTKVLANNSIADFYANKNVFVTGGKNSI
jgi:hypothetical protein